MLLGVIAEHAAALKGTLRVDPLPLSELPAYATIVLKSNEEVSRPAAVFPLSLEGHLIGILLVLHHLFSRQAYAVFLPSISFSK